MTTVLSEKQQQELLNRGFSRRTFGRIASILTAGAALPFYNEPALAQLSRVDAPPDAVMINSNENPLGPCKEAREAAHKMRSEEHTSELQSLRHLVCRLLLEKRKQ